MSKKEYIFENIRECSLIRFYKINDSDFNFLNELIKIEIYFDDSLRPKYNEDIAEIKRQKNSPQNSAFEVEIPANSKKAKIILSTSTNFDLNTIKSVAV